MESSSTRDLVDNARSNFCKFEKEISAVLLKFDNMPEQYCLPICHFSLITIKKVEISRRHEASLIYFGEIYRTAAFQDPSQQFLIKTRLSAPQRRSSLGRRPPLAFLTVPGRYAFAHIDQRASGLWQIRKMSLRRPALI